LLELSSLNARPSPTSIYASHAQSQDDRKGVPRARSAPIPAVDAPLALSFCDGPAFAPGKHFGPGQQLRAGVKDVTPGRDCTKPSKRLPSDIRGLTVASANSSQETADVSVKGPPPLADDEPLDCSDVIATPRHPPTPGSSLLPNLDPTHGPTACNLAPEGEVCTDIGSREAIEVDRPGVDDSEYELSARDQLCENPPPESDFDDTIMPLFTDYDSSADPLMADFLDSMLY
jgi:hypothetical protein